MSENNIIILSRDVDAHLIPSGARVYLHKGTEVTITQALGSSYTVNIYGNLARIEGKNADALGKESVLDSAALPQNASLSDTVWNQLRTCYDPEIPVNIVDLGLIYQCDLLPVQASGTEKSHRIDIKMTLTAPGCGMGPVLIADIKQKLSDLPQISEVNVELVFDPPWTRDRMSDLAQLELGLF